MKKDLRTCFRDMMIIRIRMSENEDVMSLEYNKETGLFKNHLVHNMWIAYQEGFNKAIYNY